MALIEAVFKRNADNRTMSFQAISEETRLPVDEVEHLVMKALRYVGQLVSVRRGRRNRRCCADESVSLKLIRGSLDQVEQKAQISWVQPRVLSREQIGQLAQRLDSWVNKLNSVERQIAPEMLISA